MTQTQEIITHRVSKIHNWICRDVYDGGKFIKEWQVENKIIESFFFPICIKPFTNDSNSRNNKLIGFGKFTNGYEELCMSEGKFSKPWQVTDKIIEWFILQFMSYILWMTQTQEKITCRVLKILKWYEGMCMSWAKIPKPWQVTCKMIEWLFLQFIFYILQMTQTQEIITHRVSKIHKWIHGDVYIRGKVS